MRRDHSSRGAAEETSAVAADAAAAEVVDRNLAGSSVRNPTYHIPQSKFQIQIPRCCTTPWDLIYLIDRKTHDRHRCAIGLSPFVDDATGRDGRASSQSPQPFTSPS